MRGKKEMLTVCRKGLKIPRRDGKMRSKSDTEREKGGRKVIKKEKYTGGK